ncbi:uncharacterized protein TNCV_2388811 [Trichonephila clavipes]|nr:uncharacterized protein TNCV_2388811 [Trichonephila clavipes]
MTARRYKNMLENFVAPQMLQHQCLDSITFMQDGAPPHIRICVQQSLRQHFTNDRVISRAFPTAWPPRSPDLNPCDFWLWGVFKKPCLSRTSDNLGRFEGQYHSACENHLCWPITISS